MINSGHRYKFIRSVTLQAITKYKFMVGRSQLPEGDIRFKPLYRARCFDQLRRDIAKKVEGSTWYKGIEVYDKFRNDWKSSIKYHGMRMDRKRSCKNKSRLLGGGIMKKEDNEVKCAMFIPPSENSLLL